MFQWIQTLIESQRELTPIDDTIDDVLFRDPALREIDTTFPSRVCFAYLYRVYISVSLTSRPYVRRARRFPVGRGVFREMFSRRYLRYHRRNFRPGVILTLPRNHCDHRYYG